MSKLLLALQFYQADRAQAMQVAKLIADLEPQHNPAVDFLFVSRFDCTHDMRAIDYVSSKFKVFHHINRNRRGVGWPSGPNDLWFGTFDHICSYSEAKIMPEYDAILTFEADACPLVPYWHKALMTSWQNVNKKRPVKVHGAMLKAPGVHINGNCLFSGDQPFLNLISRKIGGCSPISGWDFFLAKQFAQAGWQDCPQMKSYWQRPTMGTDEIDALIDSGVAFLHGVKNYDVIDHVRRRFVH